MKRLVDGQRKVVHSKFKLFDSEVKVEAYRVDSDTPYVILTHRNGTEIYLTDVGAKSLVERLNKALLLLPSSK